MDAGDAFLLVNSGQLWPQSELNSFSLVVRFPQPRYTFGDRHGRLRRWT